MYVSVSCRLSSRSRLRCHYKNLFNSKHDWTLHVGVGQPNGNYRTRAIMTHGLYTFSPLFEVHLCTVTFGLMYG